MSPRSIRTDRPIDPITVEILRAVAGAAEAEQIAHMLVGATARDLLLTHVFGLAVQRATHDVDFAVAVKDWDQFEALRARLVAQGTFNDGGGAKQRLHYQGVDGLYDYHLDLVPFGEIAQGTSQVAWPPDLKTVMNIAGYDEVLAAAESVEVAPGFVQKVVSIAGLAILKIVAWSDRGRANPKDALDLIFLMDSYAAAGNLDRIYNDDQLIAAGGHDPDNAGAYLLGQDIRHLASASTLDVLKKIIDDDFGRLTLEMMKPMRHIENIEDRVTLRLQLLQRALA
nr:nucleotidyl transferase AbiEii/AbiGii toxin family protein [uncultured Duganella sp.]